MAVVSSLFWSLAESTRINKLILRVQSSFQSRIRLFWQQFCRFNLKWQQFARVNQRQIAFSRAQLFAEFRLKVFYSLCVILDTIKFIDCLCFFVSTLEFMVQSNLIFFEVNLPPIEVTEFQISNIINFQKCFEILV